ncbi:MAG: DUF2911 domain-containing protein [Cyclobacteriaceae bacterium]|nr:DUF2911 domain-containing protein [Cyclobacteriaceae bacterium]
MKINKLAKLTGILLTAGTFTLISCGGEGHKHDAENHGEAVEEVTESEATEEAHKPAGSPRKSASGDLGSTAVTIDYGSPSVRERVIWGELVPYGKVWRAGANESTSIEFSNDVTINGTTVAKGKYGLFILPIEGGDWTVILNSKITWGANDYSEENDVVRVTVAPEWSEEVQEMLEYSVGDGAVHISWEKVRLSVPVQ